MLKHTTLALMLALTAIPAAASAMSIPTLLPSVTYPEEAPQPQLPLLPQSTQGE